MQIFSRAVAPLHELLDLAGPDVIGVHGLLLVDPVIRSNRIPPSVVPLKSYFAQWMSAFLGRKGMERGMI